jgi:hypothetical protein
MAYTPISSEEKLAYERARYEQGQQLRRGSFQSRLRNRIFGTADEAAGMGVGAAGKTLNQSIDIATGNIDVPQIIKYCIYFAILMMVLIAIIIFVRGFVIGVVQVACGIGHWGSGGDIACNPNSISAESDIVSARYWMWDIQWDLLCLLYISIAVIVGLLLYQYCIWLFNKLLKIDYEIKKIEQWIFGMDFEGEAEKQIETRL